MPLHTLAQVERVFEAIARNIPFFSETGLNFGRALLELGQTVVDRMRGSVEGAACGVGRRIEAFRRCLGAINEGLRHGWHGGSHRKRRGDKQTAGQRFHLVVLSLFF
ncbi:hypothetical protein D3C86_1704280 [compost metagenome]